MRDAVVRNSSGFHSNEIFFNSHKLFVYVRLLRLGLQQSAICRFIAMFAWLIMTTALLAQEQVGLQPGWTSVTRMETNKNGTFSTSGDPITVGLVASCSNAPLLTNGGNFFAAHDQAHLTIQHNYPSDLPPDVAVTFSQITSGGTFSSFGVESEADVAECGSNIHTEFRAEGDRSGFVFLQNFLKIGHPKVFIQYRFDDDEDPQYFLAAFDHTLENQLSLICTSPDFMNLTFRVHAESVNPFNSSEYIPSEGVQVRAMYTVELSFTETVTFYFSPWFETDETGDALVNVGSGGEVIDTNATLWVPAPYAALTADGFQVGYATNAVQVDDMRSFKGTLTIETKDPKDRPVGGVQIQLQGGATTGGTTNGSGVLEVEINGGGSNTKTVSIKVPPRFLPDNSITQIVDDILPSQVHAQTPAVYVAEFRISDSAVNYLNSGDTFEDFTLHVYENEVLAAEITGLKAKCESKLTPQEIASDEINRFKYPVMPESSLKTYRHEVVWTNERGDDLPLMYSSASVPIREERVPALDRPLHIHYVGFETSGVTTIGGKGVRGTYTSASGMAALNDFFRLIYPGTVIFTIGPDIQATEPWFTFGPFRKLSYFVDLQHHLDTMPGRPDLIVGITGPGVFGADGYSEPRFRDVILLDGVAIRKNYLLHEYMHTLGKLDNYDYETGANDCGASGNGYDPRTMTRVYNSPGVLKPPFQTMMYDHAPNPWMTHDDYITLLDEATMGIDYGKSSEDTKSKTVAPKTDPQDVMLVSGTIMGKQVWTNFNYTLREAWPIFIDTDLVSMPQEPATPSGRAIMAELSNGQSAQVLEFTQWIGEPDPEGDGNLAAAPLFKFPYDPTVNSVTFKTINLNGQITTIKTINFSPHAPTVTIDSPTGGTVLQSNMPIVFQANDEDANEQLYAWVKMSFDGGASWQPMGTWLRIERGQNEYLLTCNDLPSVPGVLLRVLVSDGTRSARAESGPYPLNGYNMTSHAEAIPVWHKAKVSVGAPCALPVTLRNTGMWTLEATLQSDLLPAWITARQPIARSINSGGSTRFLFDCNTATEGTFATNLTFNTNDPDLPVLEVPLTLEVTSQPTPPSVIDVASDPSADAGDLIAWDGDLHLVVSELCSRTGLSGSIAIHHAQTGDLLETLNLAPGTQAGIYEVDWPVPDDLLAEPLAFEATLEDTATSLTSNGGSNPLGWDLELRLMRRNTPPEFTNPTGNTNVTVWFPSVLEIPFAATDNEGDPIHFAVKNTEDLDVVLDEANGLLHVSYLIDAPHESQSTIQLIATDRWGASNGVTFTVGIYYASTPYAYIVGHDSVWLDANPYSMTIAGAGTSERPQKVRVDYRETGTIGWTNLGEYSFTRFDSQIQFWVTDVSWNWLENGPYVYDLQLTLFASDGTPDPNPPIYHFERLRTGGRVTSIEAPTTVGAGASITLQVHVENESSDRWSFDTGYGLLATEGTDALTRLQTVRLSQLNPIERGTSGVIQIEATAPTIPGSYTTSWVLQHDGVAFGESASASVQVTPSVNDATARAAIMDAILGRISTESMVVGKLDINLDGQIDVADLRKLIANINAGSR